jgi:hypothetical protein
MRFSVLCSICLLAVFAAGAVVHGQETTVSTPPEFAMAEYRVQTQTGWTYYEYTADKVEEIHSPLVSDYSVVLVDKGEMKDDCLIVNAKLDMKKIMYWDSLTRWTVEFPCPDITGSIGEITRGIANTYNASFGQRLAVREQNIGLCLLALNGREFRIAVVNDGSGARLLDFETDLGARLAESFSADNRSIFKSYMNQIVSMLFPPISKAKNGECYATWKQGELTYSAKPGRVSSVIPDARLIFVSGAYKGKLPIRFSLADVFFRPADSNLQERIKSAYGSTVAENLYDSGLRRVIDVNETDFKDCYEIESSTGLVESRVIACGNEYRTFSDDEQTQVRVPGHRATISIQGRLQSQCAWRVDLLKVGSIPEGKDAGVGAATAK